MIAGCELNRLQDAARHHINVVADHELCRETEKANRAGNTLPACVLIHRHLDTNAQGVHHAAPIHWRLL